MGSVRGCYLGTSGLSERRRLYAQDGQLFETTIDCFNAETDAFPYPDGQFNCVLCCELLEHLQLDPMHMMLEIHRVLKPDGVLVLTTPNIASLRSVAAVLEGAQPGLYTCYTRPSSDAKYKPRHAREYTPGEVCQLITDAGFAVTSIETFAYDRDGTEDLRWVQKLLNDFALPAALRDACICTTARKASNGQMRFPPWLYDG